MCIPKETIQEKPITPYRALILYLAILFAPILRLRSLLTNVLFKNVVQYTCCIEPNCKKKIAFCIHFKSSSINHLESFYWPNPATWKILFNTQSSAGARSFFDLEKMYNQLINQEIAISILFLLIIMTSLNRL